MLKKAVGTGLLAATLALLCAAPALAGARPQEVFVVNNTRFELVAREAVIPAGESARFEVRSDHFGRVSLLVAGSTAPGAGSPAIVTLFGPPLVPAAPPRPLRVNEDGRIRDRLIEPVFGPAMVIVVHNDTGAEATITLSAYFTN